MFAWSCVGLVQFSWRRCCVSTLLWYMYFSFFLCCYCIIFVFFSTMIRELKIIIVIQAPVQKCGNIITTSWSVATSSLTSSVVTSVFNTLSYVSRDMFTTFSVGYLSSVWLGSLTVTCRTCNPEVTQGRRFDSAPGHCRVTTLGKLFTHMCLCHQAV